MAGAADARARPSRTSSCRTVADAVRELRSRGIEFDEYDTPRLRTIDGVATIGHRHYAWFHDPDDNVIGIHD